MRLRRCSAFKRAVFLAKVVVSEQEAHCGPDGWLQTRSPDQSNLSARIGEPMNNLEWLYHYGVVPTIWLMAISFLLVLISALSQIWAEQKRKIADLSKPHLIVDKKKALIELIRRGKSLFELALPSAIRKVDTPPDWQQQSQKWYSEAKTVIGDLFDEAEVMKLEDFDRDAILAEPVTPADLDYSFMNAKIRWLEKKLESLG